MTWDLASGRQFIRIFNEHLHTVGYACGLTGSVLERGKSNKDLDVIVFPLKKLQAISQVDLERSIQDFGMKFVRLPNHGKGYTDDGKLVQVWSFFGLRVDLFFLS